MNTAIDKHTIATLRTLASQCDEAGHQAAMAPETLAALLDHLEETEGHLQRYMRLADALGHPLGIDGHVAEQQAAAIDKWSVTIIQMAEWAAGKHNEDPSFPPVNLQLFRELCCDMDDDADRLRRQTEATLAGRKGS